MELTENQMLRIAVVGYHNALLQMLRQYFVQYQIDDDFELSVEYITSCENVYQRMLAGENFDLLYIDTGFPEHQGTELGLMIRERLRDHDTQIVILSSGQEYPIELFRIRPSGFLCKPISYEYFAACLKSLLHQFRHGHEFLEYTLENTRHIIRVREVLYLKAYGKRVAFQTRAGNFTVYGKIPDLIAGCNERFLCVSRGEYVNLQHIVAASPKEVRLSDNHVLQISRGRLRAVHARLSEL